MPPRRSAWRIPLALSILTLLLPVVSAVAQDAPQPTPYRITLDAEASTIDWTLGATMHTVEGTFRFTSGEVTYDPATGEVSGEVIVDATSGESGNDKRDRDMHQKVLESEQYPRFVFTPERLEGAFDPTTASRVTVHGTLEIHGGRHEISVPMTAAVNDGAFEATGSFTVPYVEWGMEDPSRFILRVDKEVEVTVRAEGTLEQVEPAAAASEGDAGRETGSETGSEADSQTESETGSEAGRETGDGETAPAP